MWGSQSNIIYIPLVLSFSDVASSISLDVLSAVRHQQSSTSSITNHTSLPESIGSTSLARSASRQLRSDPFKLGEFVSVIYCKKYIQDYKKCSQHTQKFCQHHTWYIYIHNSPDLSTVHRYCFVPTAIITRSPPDKPSASLPRTRLAGTTEKFSSPSHSTRRNVSAVHNSA